MIDGVSLTPLRRFDDERGSVLNMLRCDDPIFQKFGEIYFSTVRPGAVKAWKRHRQMTLNLTAVVGRIRVVLFDDRVGSPTLDRVEEVVLSPDQHRLLTVPPWIWLGFQGIAAGESILANCATIPHDPHEGERRDPDDPAIPYGWLPVEPGSVA